jgi:hypothetical protein
VSRADGSGGLAWHVVAAGATWFDDEWEPKGAPRRVNVHDFADQELGKAVPYGVYDVTANTGWVNVGTDADTGQFAVESIRRWWNAVGNTAHPERPQGADHRRLRRVQRQPAPAVEDRAGQPRAETGLEITVLHLPPGTSKWNRVEHRLFSAITMSWRGRPLESHQVVIETINAVTTKTGLKVHAMLDTNTSPRASRSPTGHEEVRGPPPAPTRLPRGLELHDHRQQQPTPDTPKQTDLIVARVLSGRASPWEELVAERVAEPTLVALPIPALAADEPMEDV